MMNTNLHRTAWSSSIMKRSTLWIILTAIAFLAVMAGPAGAQQKQKHETAMEGVITKVGGFSEVVAKYGDFNSDFGWILGGRAGITLNDVFWIGGAYYSKADKSVKADFRAGDRAPYLNFEYGGLDFEYIVSTYDLFHFSVQALLGYGGYSYTDPEGIIDFEDTYFYIFEPGLNFELNITEWMRLQWGLSFRILLDSDNEANSIDYRFGRQVQEYDFDSNDLTNISFLFGVKFGGFE